MKDKQTLINGFAIKTGETHHISTVGFRRWQIGNDPTLTYARGDLSADCDPIHVAGNAELHALRQHVWAAHESGEILLTQRACGKPDPHRCRAFEYVATRRKVTL